jgi:hypothetical protein
MSVFRVAELPEEKSSFRTIAERMDFLDACARVAPQRPVRGLLRLKLPAALFAGLRRAALEAIARHGVHGWLSEEGRDDDGAYLSLSLTYNPQLEDPGVEDVHQSTLGTSVNPRAEFFYGSTQRFRKLKNTYFDTYGFRVPTPAARTGALGEFLSGCRLSLVRSRLSVLRGHEAACAFDFGWHRDEPVFENFRVNIPLQSHRGARLQLERVREQPHRRSRTMSDHYLAPGYAYTFDTHRPHRVYTRTPSEVERVHLVLGFSPWFRYDAAADAWEPNEFYGRVHPFDILRSGALHPSLRVAS